MTEQPEPQWLADIKRQGKQMVEQSQRLQEELGGLTETAQSDDGAVRVSVGAGGALSGLEIDQRAMSRQSAELSAEILRLAARAQAAAARRAMAVVAPVAGESGMDFLRSQLPSEEPEEAPAAPAPERRAGGDDDEPPQTFMRRVY
ncbi:YbaB/EbfC family nucleoid-associated protein [Amycolatopsis suaedae]|uniref:YbaB/EbfC family DNA-binding protein n=1 Tax=Amycolatopsis suaedae TaxID=2510978 RepID=A0A4Q7JFL5_9PSEU|nr:YbaB/EbfC family nucleoid-associated protein [Amycolatopsis suaedae]RZQ65683.1 YbaB/EbfC family DNA-binding protein [Amycolatopsis suaedae]